MDCISSSLQIAPDQDQNRSPAAATHSAPVRGQPGLGTSLLGSPQGWEITASTARGHQGGDYPLLLPLTPSGPHLDAASKGANRVGQVPWRPPRRPGAGAMAAALDIFEDQMRFLGARKHPTVFPLSFFPPPFCYR